MDWYYTFLVRRPYLMVVGITILCTACIIVSLTTKAWPDFTDPTLGFEVRGSDIGRRLTTWHNLLQETRSGRLVSNPGDLLRYQHEHDIIRHTINKIKKHRNRKKQRKHKNKNKKKHPYDSHNKLHTLKSLQDEASEENDITSVSERSPSEWNGDKGVFRDYEITNVSLEVDTLKHSHFDYGKNTSFLGERDRLEIQSNRKIWEELQRLNQPTLWDNIHVPIDGYFCGSPSKEFSHFVVERIGPNSTDSLFNVNSLLASCQLEQQIISVSGYGEYCQKELLTENCCRPWSIPNYIALLSNKSSCFDLNQHDVELVENLLVSCFEHFYTLRLSNDCSETGRCRSSYECIRHDAVFNILHFLADANFIKVNSSNIYLKYAMIFVPIAQTTKILPLFYEWQKTDLSNELVQVKAMDLGLKNALFDACLLTDGWLVALGAVFVMTCMWLYTSSIFLTVMTCIAVLFSLGLAYFLYTLVFEMEFFPFMNLLAIVVIIGIGADDAFIFVKIWQCMLVERLTKSSSGNAQSLTTDETEYTDSLEYLMASTLRHSAVSMFVTTLTTAGAFYASYVSSITAVKCFGIFAGTAVIANYGLMITWLPACMSIMERIIMLRPCMQFCPKNILQKINKSIKTICVMFEELIIEAVLKFSVLWVILFTILGLCSSVIVFYRPGLQLPDSSQFHLFVSNHPFETYDAKFRDEFWFEKSTPSIDNFKLPLRFVWGVQPIDDGDQTDPFSRGTLHFDNNFNISSKASQTWLLGFCKNIKQQPFYQLTLGLLLPNCFIENFITHMNRMCIDGMDGIDRTPCCDISQFPYEPHVFELCLPEIITSLYATPREYFIPSVAGPKFMQISHNTLKLSENATTQFPPVVKAVVIEFESNISFSANYKETKSFVSSIEAWFANELRSAPAELQNGWFTSELGFFDLQDTLSRDTIIAIAMAMTTSLLVLLCVTFNVLISLYAVITVSFSIITTVAILILLDWKLNILESVSISTSIGLTVDFSLHYGIHYRMSPENERIAATTFALSRLIGPSAMAALTTGFAGLLMLGSSVLPYIQIGIFLVIVMSVSWSYATLFLMSLLKLAGPQHGFMQFSFTNFKKRQSGNGIKYYERKQSQVIANEQLLTPSSSAMCDLVNSESHELDSLTSNSLIKPLSVAECSRPPIDIDRAFIRSKITAADSSTNSNVSHVPPPNANYQSPSSGSAITVILPDDCLDCKALAQPSHNLP